MNISKQDLREYAIDFIDSFSNHEIACLVIDEVFTMEEIEKVLRLDMLKKQMETLCRTE